MADSKITALTALTAADPANDMIPIVDVSDTPPASGNTKRISINNILACSPSATLASATISGNLTVRTNALTVDANNNVGIGTTAPTVYTNYRTLAIVGGSTGGVIDINPSGGVTAGGLQIGCTAAATNIDAFGPSAGTAAPLVLRTGTFGSVAERYRVAGDGVATWSNVGGGSGTAMTLNSTGLGVGGSPAASKVEVYSSNTGTSGLAEANALKVENNNATVGNAAGLFLSQSGNAGCGVAAIATSRTGGSRASALSLYYYNQATSASPIEGARIDTSGNLLVTKAAYGLTVGFAAAATGSVDSVMASAVGAQSTLNVYSTGAAAYRFYVSMNGTINATNTTISAISDARLKENVEDIDVGLGAILALKPRKFDWKAGKGKDIKGDRGFIAQEFETVFPQLVDEWKDNAPEGEAPYKSVRQDLIPVLVKAIQELAAEVNALKNA
jgi:hypothetical protein